MLEKLLLVLQFLFLGTFYLFLFKLTLTILEDLRNQCGGIKKRPGRAEKLDLQPEQGGAGLIVLASTDHELPPGTQIPLGNHTTLGRDSASRVRVKDKFVSSQHAVISYRNGQYWIEDLGSLNGTYVNEVKLEQPVVLADGDRLRVGGVSFQFVRWAYAVEPNNRGGIGQTG
ncbi:hypothetical protein JOC37_002160 [Desulfohalotomaculum tongense]|uniref:FHA domain-containing protein n=1 Tax=Desulforadius tongensis TaxID=1216062 RepID=UPI00195A5220|nr:FHA domain-containing protein [Desulforadius tongensis]MBM7855745.1 hypothetical protein [Desulforadius tongensis]